MYSKDQAVELRKIVEFLLSKDVELFELGLISLRKSKLYRELKPQTLFYYPKGVGTTRRYRTSSYLNERIHILADRREDTKPYVRGSAKMQLKQMFDDLLSKDVRKYFRREFVNTSKIL